MRLYIYFSFGADETCFTEMLKYFGMLCAYTYVDDYVYADRQTHILKLAKTSQKPFALVNISEYRKYIYQIYTYITFLASVCPKENGKHFSQPIFLFICIVYSIVVAVITLLTKYFMWFYSLDVT